MSQNVTAQTPVFCSFVMTLYIESQLCGSCHDSAMHASSLVSPMDAYDHDIVYNV